MKGSRGKRSKAATRTVKVEMVGKPQVEEPRGCSPRLRSKLKVDYNENVLALKGDVEKVQPTWRQKEERDPEEQNV